MNSISINNKSYLVCYHSHLLWLGLCEESLQLQHLLQLVLPTAEAETEKHIFRCKVYQSNWDIVTCICLNHTHLLEQEKSFNNYFVVNSAVFGGTLCKVLNKNNFTAAALLMIKHCMHYLYFFNIKALTNFFKAAWLINNNNYHKDQEIQIIIKCLFCSITDGKTLQHNLFSTSKQPITSKQHDISISIIIIKTKKFRLS